MGPDNFQNEQINAEEHGVLSLSFHRERGRQASRALFSLAALREEAAEMGCLDISDDVFRFFWSGSTQGHLAADSDVLDVGRGPVCPVQAPPIVPALKPGGP